MSGGQKSGRPIARPVWREATRIRKNHKRWQTLVHATETIENPSAHGRIAGQDEADGLHEGGRPVYIRFRHHRVNERDVVHAGGQVRHQIAYPFAATAALFPLPWAGHHRAGTALEQLDFATRVEFLAVTLNEFRFVIEGVALAGGTRHK